MRSKEIAFNDLTTFATLVRDGLHVDKRAGKPEYGDHWEEFKFATVTIRIGNLVIESTRHNGKVTGKVAGKVSVRVWNFKAHPYKRSKFSMDGDVPHVARVVSDYVNEYEGE